MGTAWLGQASRAGPPRRRDLRWALEWRLPPRREGYSPIELWVGLTSPPEIGYNVTWTAACVKGFLSWHACLEPGLVPNLT